MKSNIQKLCLILICSLWVVDCSTTESRRLPAGDSATVAIDDYVKEHQSEIASSNEKIYQKLEVSFTSASVSPVLTASVGQRPEVLQRLDSMMRTAIQSASILPAGYEIRGESFTLTSVVDRKLSSSEKTHSAYYKHAVLKAGTFYCWAQAFISAQERNNYVTLTCYNGKSDPTKYTLNFDKE